MGQLIMAQRMLRQDWCTWHTNEGHIYYKRLALSFQHLQGLSRLDFFVLVRIWAGLDKAAHVCARADDRYHIVECLMYEDGRPDAKSLFFDKYLRLWKSWWIRHDFLGYRIPSTTRSVARYMIV